MPSRISAAPARLAALGLAVVLVLGACSSTSSSTAGEPTPSPSRTDSSAPSAPSPSSTGAGSQVAAARRRFASARASLLRGAGGGQDTIYIAGAGNLWDSSWTDGGRVYDVTYESGAGQPGLEVRRTSGRVLARASGSPDSCWWPQPVTEAGQFSYTVMPKVTLLRSVRITGVRTGVTQATVAVSSLLQMLGAPDALRRKGFVSLPGQRAPAEISTAFGALSITVDMAPALLGRGSPSRRGQWNWTMKYAPLAGGLPPVPTSRIIAVPRADPAWQARLNACNRRTP